jgi:dipeptidyl aminopeptidase/acylaminoacyl peptidase
MKRLKLGRRQVILGTAASIGVLTLGVGTAQTRIIGSDEPHLNGGGELIPRRVLFGDPDRSAARISPDGTRLAFLAPLDGVLNLWVGPIDDIETARAFTRVTDRNLGPWLSWLPNNRHVLFFRDQGGDENWQTFRVDLEDGSILPLSPSPGVKSYVHEISHRFPDEVLIAHNQRDKRYHEIFRVDVKTGESTLLQGNDRFGGFFTDSHFRVRFAVRMTDEGGQEYLKPTAERGWEAFARIALDDAMNTRPLDFSDDGKELYWLDARGRDKAVLAVQDLTTGAMRVLAEDPSADVEEVTLEPRTARAIAASSVFTRRRWQTIDPAYAADYDYLTKDSPGDLTVLGLSDDRQNWLVSYEQDAASRRYLHYDRAKQQSRFLFSSRAELETFPLAAMEPVTVRTRDGLQMVCYLSRPRAAEQGKPGPMVLFVHGGPWGRDHWGLNPTHQWFADRGYAVLSVNFRGSTGFGKAFVNAANREWGGKMHDDLIDAVDWAIAQNIADPKRVAIYGGSYGGYSALAGVTFTPEKFACSVNLVGVSNLMTLMNTIPEYWKPWQALWKARMGDYTTEEGRKFLHERSPLTYVQRIVRPLLIGHGANDPRVKVAESEQIVAAMQQRNIPVTYVYYPDEGHGFRRPENRRSFNAVMEAFLGKHLGGRIEPVGDDFKRSSIEFRAGRDLIPGLG